MNAEERLQKIAERMRDLGPTLPAAGELYRQIMELLPPPPGLIRPEDAGIDTVYRVECEGRKHKAWRHSDGELCFGGGWFIVCATTPHGLVSNHYSASSWQYFDIPEREVPVEYDGHTPAEALRRLMDTAADYAEGVGTDA